MDNLLLLGQDALDSELLLSLLRKAGIVPPPVHLHLLKGGANNRVLRIDLQNSDSLVLKTYFHHAQDTRPRLRAEFEFLTYAWNQNLRNIPKPLAADPTKNGALYSYIDGSQPTHATPLFVQHATSFLTSLNKNKKEGTHLLPASEACTTLHHYTETVEKKLSRLLHSPQETALEKKMHQFLHQELIPRWNHITNGLCKATLHHLDPEPEDLIISPSDFGLHNALLHSSGTPYFIDFEYAGWDDPAKTIADFFLQPKIPIPFSHFQSFARAIAQLSLNGEKTLQRTIQVLPICQIKWCCIILNVFTKTDKTRREFSQGIISQTTQLEIAKNYLFSTPIDHR